ncbi:hypothetical protein BDQ17DRAFT_1370021 [Cyathus striatus]|nr:hypothetical protein BDQ17DRAFT_1370021 [Cyathus striatus]
MYSTELSLRFKLSDTQATPHTTNTPIYTYRNSTILLCLTISYLFFTYRCLLCYYALYTCLELRLLFFLWVAQLVPVYLRGAITVVDISDVCS